MTVATTGKQSHTQETSLRTATDHAGTTGQKSTITAQAVFDATRLVERPWTDRELAKIASRNNEYGLEQQQASRYECRCIMTTVVKCKIVKNGLIDPLMRKVATKIAEECTSTDGFKAKLTQIEEFNQRAKSQNRQTPAMGQEEHSTITQNAMGKEILRAMKCKNRREMKREQRRLTCQGCKETRKHIHPTHGQTMLVQP
jgi:hypothetical protein